MILQWLHQHWPIIYVVAGYQPSYLAIMDNDNHGSHRTAQPTSNWYLSLFHFSQNNVFIDHFSKNSIHLKMPIIDASHLKNTLSKFDIFENKILNF